jgi:hypothetical protein
MRTTLDIDDDVLAAARDLARAEDRTMGEVISDLARRALTQPQYGGMAEAPASFMAHDWPMFPSRSGPLVSSEQVRRIQDEIDAEDGIPWDHKRDAPRVFDDPVRPKKR